MNKKYLIIHIINNLSLGGAQKLVSDLIIESKKEFELAVIVLNSSNGLFDEVIKKENIQIVSLFPLSIKNIYKIIKYLKLADLIHVHLFPLLYICSIIPGKKVFTEHNTWNRRRELKVLRKIEKKIYKNYDGIISISNKTRDTLSDWLDGIPTKYSPVIYNGINLKKFSCKPIGKHEYTIGMMGTFSAQKDQETILRALKLLPQKFTATFAGDGELQEKLMGLSKTLKIDDRVKFLGRIIDVDDYLNSIDVYVQSSNWEGFGLAPLEAMAKRIPTIGSNVIGLDEVIGSNRYLFKKNNPEELVRLIKYIFSKREFYVKAQKYSYSRSQEFSIDDTNSAYSRLYRHIIK